MTRIFAVVSGLPGSGKSTLAERLSVTLNLPLLDKDDILESLFDSLGVATPAERSRLSRASDLVLQQIAASTQGAVLSSFWRHPSLSEPSGTPADWLEKLRGASVVEVLCECPPALAATRFAARQRHPGHFDEYRTRAELVSQLEHLAALGPLGIGTLVRVDTSVAVDVEVVAQAVRASAA